MFTRCVDHNTDLAAPRCCLKVGSFCTLPWDVLPPWCAYQTWNRAGTMWAALYIGCAFLMAFSSLFGYIRARSELLYWLRRKVRRCQCAVAPWVSVSHVDFGGGGLQLCVEPAAFLGLHGTQVWIKFSHGSKIDNRPVVCVCEIGAYLLLPCWDN